MKRLAGIFFIIAVSVSSLFAQPGPNKVDAKGRKQGEWKKLDKEGKVIYEGKFIDDKPDGKFTYYYPNGKVKIISEFSQKGKIARSKLFYETGKLMAEGKYVDEKRDSVWRFYNDTVLVSEEPYLIGKKNGVVKIYFPNGKVAEEKPYKADVMDGVWKQYYDDGMMKAQARYVNGLMEGKCYFYFPTGKPSVEGTYEHSLKIGTWTYYKANGQVEKTEQYKNGQPEGEPVLVKPDELDKLKNDPQLQKSDQQKAPR